MSKKISKRQGVLNSLLERGFDESYVTPFQKGATVKCSQCQACAINGVACHETGCPNQTHECDECGTTIKRGFRLCPSCAEEEYSPDYDTRDQEGDDE